MTPEDKDHREAEIATATLALLIEGGLSGVSMSAVAREVKASNETLYRWYGDKTGLLCNVMARHVASLRAEFEAAPPDVSAEGLRAAGERVLAAILSPPTTALYRAAAADGSNQLSAALSQQAHDVVLPWIIAYFEGLRREEVILADPTAAADLWLDLLIGGAQARLITGAIPTPDEAARASRATLAAARLMVLCG